MSLHKDFNLLGGIDNDKKKVATFEKKYKKKGYLSYNDFLSDTDEAVDLIIISTPTSDHLNVLKYICKFNIPKSILIEKPIALNLNEAKKMHLIIKNIRSKIYVNYVRIYDPSIKQLKKLFIKKNKKNSYIGSIWYTKGFIHSGSHWFNLCERLFGEMLSFKILDNGKKIDKFDSDIFVMVNFKNARIVFLPGNENNFSYNTMEIMSDKGILYWDNENNITWKSFNLNSNKQFTTSKKIKHNLDYYQKNVLSNIKDSLRNKKTEICTFSDGFKTFKNMHKIIDKVK